MIAIHLDRVSITYIAQPVFTDLSWDIHDDRCVGLIGPNGSGKSTLLRLLGGLLENDTGYVVCPPGLSVGYLPQEPEVTQPNTVWQEALASSVELARIETDLNSTELQLANPAIYGDEDILAGVLEEQARLLDQYVEAGGPNYEGRVRSKLRELGFTGTDLDLPVEALSGGQKKLLALVKLLVIAPNVLLLDEPDNHLDLAKKALIEQVIQNYEGAVIIISHDRYLLDLVVDEIAELVDGRLTRYQGDYSEYVFQKQTELQRQQQLYQVQAKEVSRLEQSAKRLLTWGRVYDNEKLIKRGQSILKRLERMERIEKPILERRQMALELAGWRGSDKVLDISSLIKVFPTVDGGETILLAGLDLLIWHGERVGLVGPNGCGKSFLFRLILGQEEANEGAISIGPSIETGYYAQEHETLDYDRTLIETVRQSARLSESEAVGFLGKFLFSYEQARGLVSKLSGGERSRLQLAILMLSNANFLLLDEPTNNLDIPSAEVLEDVLSDFMGTVFVISHDRYFLDRVVDRVVELDDGDLSQFAGNFSDYQAARTVGQQS